MWLHHICKPLIIILVISFFSLIDGTSWYSKAKMHKTTRIQHWLALVPKHSPESITNSHIWKIDKVITQVTKFKSCKFILVVKMSPKHNSGFFSFYDIIVLVAIMITNQIFSFTHSTPYRFWKCCGTNMGSRNTSSINGQLKWLCT